MEPWGPSGSLCRAALLHGALCARSLPTPGPSFLIVFHYCAVRVTNVCLLSQG